jgi:hypothetical protein
LFGKKLCLACENKYINKEELGPNLLIGFSDGFAKDFKGRSDIEFLLMKGIFEEGEIRIVGEEEEVF